MSAHLITLKCGQTDPGPRPETGANFRDAITGMMPQLWAGARTSFRLLLQNPVTGGSISTADWVLLTFRFLAQDRETLYASKTVLPADFTGGDPQETTVTLSSTETSRAEGEYWVCIFATLASGGLLPLWAAPIKVTNAGMLTTEPGPAVTEPIYTQDEVDALLAARPNTVSVNGQMATWIIGEIGYSMVVVPVATPSGVEVDGVTIFQNELIVTYLGESYSAGPVVPIS